MTSRRYATICATRAKSSRPRSSRPSWPTNGSRSRSCSTELSSSSTWSSPSCSSISSSTSSTHRRQLRHHHHHHQQQQHPQSTSKKIYMIFLHTRKEATISTHFVLISFCLFVCLFVCLIFFCSILCLLMCVCVFVVAAALMQLQHA